MLCPGGPTQQPVAPADMPAQHLDFQDAVECVLSPHSGRPIHLGGVLGHPVGTGGLSCAAECPARWACLGLHDGCKEERRLGQGSSLLKTPAPADGGRGMPAAPPLSLSMADHKLFRSSSVGQGQMGWASQATGPCCGPPTPAALLHPTQGRGHGLGQVAHTRAGSTSQPGPPSWDSPASCGVRQAGSCFSGSGGATAGVEICLSPEATPLNPALSGTSR